MAKFMKRIHFITSSKKKKSKMNTNSQFLELDKSFNHMAMEINMQFLGLEEYQDT